MTSTTFPLTVQFDLHTRLFNNALDGISDEVSNKRGTEQINNMKWIAGHILNTRVNFLTHVTGGKADDSFVPLFGRGNSFNPDTNYPPISELTAKWNEASGAVSEGLSKLPEDVLDSTAPFQGPIEDTSLRGLLAFLISHEAYHIGQLSLLRRMAGQEAMSYKIQ